MQPVLDVQTREEPDRPFDVVPVLAQAHTASKVADAAIFAYVAPALHTVTTGQAVTGELDEIFVDNAAYVPLEQGVQIESDDEVAAVW